MLILIILVLITATGIWLEKQDHEWGMVPAIIGGIAVVFGLVFIPINHTDTKAKLAGIQAVEESVARARADLDVDTLESAALQHMIVEANGWLAKHQYYNHTIWGLWIPDVIDEQEMIR